MFNVFFLTFIVFVLSVYTVYDQKTWWEWQLSSFFIFDLIKIFNTRNYTGTGLNLEKY